MARILYCGIIQEDASVMSIGGFPANYPDPEPHFGTIQASDGSVIDLTGMTVGRGVIFLADQWENGLFKNATYFGDCSNYVANFIAHFLQPNSEHAENYFHLHPATPQVGG
jgi:hypothetical protein